MVNIMKKLCFLISYFITDEITPDIHSAVVKLCDQLCSIVPDVDLVNARAIDINGNELRFGDTRE